MIPGTLRKVLPAVPCWGLLHPDGSPYLTRYVLWGDDALETHAGAAHSAFVHHIHGPDSDRHMHDHPWSWAVSVILSGGYKERRPYGDAPRLRTYSPGDLSVLRPGDYHSIVAVEPDTWTLFLCGREISDWGFLVDGAHVPHADYFTRSDAQHMTTVPL
jgi:hypothetical protein